MEEQELPPLTPEEIEANQAIVEKVLDEAFGDEEEISKIDYKSLLVRYLQVFYTEEGTIFERSCSPIPNNGFVWYG